MSNMKDFVIKFDEKSHLWESNHEVNMFMVRATLSHICQMFQARGYLFAREVYERFGISFPKESIIAGWYATTEYPIFEVSDKDGDSITIAFSAEEDIRDNF